MKNRISNSMFLSPITTTDILEAVQSFKRNKSPGFDEVNVSVFKKTIYFIL